MVPCVIEGARLRTRITMRTAKKVTRCQGGKWYSVIACPSILSLLYNDPLLERPGFPRGPSEMELKILDVPR